MAHHQELQVDCNLHIIFYIICEISQNIYIFTLSFKFLCTQTPDDDRLDRNTQRLKKYVEIKFVLDGISSVICLVLCTQWDG
jgi:hypothetical protein